MTTTTVTVDATKRVRHINVETPYDQPARVSGYGETILTDPASGTRVGTQEGFATVTAGMPVARYVDDVADETVITSAGEIDFATIMEALPMFFMRWAEEDAAKPPVPPPPAAKK